MIRRLAVLALFVGLAFGQGHREGTTRSAASHAPTPPAEVRGRIVGSDRAPIPEASITATTRDVSGRQLEAQTASWSDGRFSLELDTARFASFALRVEAAGRCTAKWIGASVAAGEVVELGEIVLVISGSIEGRLVDPRGSPLRLAGWRACAFEPVTSGRGQRLPGYAEADVESETGMFRLDGLPPGRLSVLAESHWQSRVPLRAQRDEVRLSGIEVRAGEVTRVELVHDPSAVTIVPRARYFPDLVDDLTQVSLTGPDGAVRHATRIEGRARMGRKPTAEQRFEDVSPGVHTIAIEDSRFLPWRREGVVPGERVEAELVGSATLDLVVTESGTAEPIDSFVVRLVLQPSSRSRGTVVASTVVRGGRRTIQGLPAGSRMVIVESAGFADGVTEIELVPNESRVLHVELSRSTNRTGDAPSGAATLAGRVVDASSGQEVPAAEVVLSSKGRRVTSTKADGAGRFGFAGLAAGTYSTEARRTAACRSAVVSVMLGEDETRGDLELALPAHVTLRGRVTLPPGASCEGVRVGAWLRRLPRSRTPDVSARLAADGSYVLEKLGPGEFDIELLGKEVLIEQQSSTAKSTLHAGAPSVALGSLVLEQGALVERDWDARLVFPGTLRCRTTIDRVSAIGAILELAQLEGPWKPAATSTCSWSGVAVLGPLPPGRYRLLARDLRTSWIAVLPALVEVRAGIESVVDVEVALVPGTILVETVGEPATDTPLEITHEDVPDRVIRAKTDASGRAALQLAPGRYEVRARGESGQFDWTSSGAAAAPVGLRSR